MHKNASGLNELQVEIKRNQFDFTCEHIDMWIYLMTITSQWLRHFSPILLSTPFFTQPQSVIESVWIFFRVHFVQFTNMKQTILPSIHRIDTQTAWNKRARVEEEE